MKQIHNSNYKPVALIVGVTGMAGLSLAEFLKSPTALNGPWKIYGLARRSKPTWFPSAAAVDDYIAFDAAKLTDTHEKLSLISGEVTHVFWVAIQVREAEEDNIKINEAMLDNVLSVLKSSPASQLSHITLQTGTKQYMARASPRSVYNTLLTLAVYATICRHEGSRFRYPGSRYTGEHFCDMSYARVLAQQHIWPAVTAQCKNQAFNCTNGDVFTWKSLWKVLCDIFDLEFLPFDESTDEFDVVGIMKNKGKVWDEIVEKYGLHKTNFEEITCFEALKSCVTFWISTCL
ncbi:hypothetical protein EZV62_000208 [Acer yangbiense]|uniref:NAD-dependent epimerase/dehydratase domain-containing protein n=1 Tax=Acer yangbiense TaxID=1000413 RepID=A0A5C7IRC3_9ROSI|nr:hypothetical protein EZV62_000208 [Acer yangbiense]